MASVLINRAPTTKPGRLYYLDWLRVLAVLTVFVYHTWRPFDLTDWHVKNAEQSLIVTIPMTLIALWGMPLFFVLAGAGSWFALRSRSGPQFVRERSLRLLVPLLVGFLLFSPLQAYFEALNHGQFADSFVQFGPWFYARLQVSWHAPWISYLYHLWFLEFLWVGSLLALPLFLYLRGAQGSRVIDTVAEWCAKPGGILLFIIPLALLRTTMWASLPGEHDWGEFVVYLTFFVYGYLLFSRPAFVDAIYRQRWIALSVGALSLLLMVGAYAAGYLETWAAAPMFSAGALLYQVVPTIYTWACLVFVLACGVHWLNFPTKRLPEANEAVLPFYVVHQPAIVLIAFYVVQWPEGILPKWLVITVLALALVLGLYVLVIRRTNVARWLFGMKPLRSDAPGKVTNQPHAAPTGSADASADAALLQPHRRVLP
jgi:peptidoglycan/LPS O-acetylase OafA/YrhL